MFRPNVQRMNTLIKIQHRKETNINGAQELSYSDADPALDFCQWKSKGGTESIQSGILVINDTAELTMWYRPDINIKDRVILDDNSDLAYEIISPPENVEMCNQYLILKVSRMVNN